MTGALIASGVLLTFCGIVWLCLVLLNNHIAGRKSDWFDRMNPVPPFVPIVLGIAWTIYFMR